MRAARYLLGTALQAALVAISFASAFPVTAQAHCEVGERTFASTMTFDDPCVSDELSLPTIQSFKNGDQPSAQELDVSGEYTKTITRNFGVSFEETWVHLDVPGEGSHSGFDNLGTSFKYQFVRDAERELAMSASLDADWGGTGAKSIGAEPFTTLTPTWFAGKGLRISSRQPKAASSARCHHRAWLLVPNPIFHNRVRGWRAHRDAQSTVSGLGWIASIQHALSQGSGAGPRLAQFRKPGLVYFQLNEPALGWQFDSKGNRF